MDRAVEQVLEELDERARREWRDGPQGSAQIAGDVRDRMLLSIGRDAGALVNMIVKSGPCRRILEIGTSYGYSTVWLAEAARETGGKVISLDLADYKQAHAAQMLERAGLRDFAEFRTGDALEIIPTLAAGIDFVLLDLWKDLYVPCLDLFFLKLAPGAVIVADNMLRPAVDRSNALDYRRAVRAKPGISSVLLPVGQGLEISRLWGPEDVGL